jgi:hypothetical protein
LGKWKTKELKGWVIKMYYHFQSMAHWNIGDQKSNVNSHMSIQYVNQSVSLSWSFPDLLGDKWYCLQRKYMCRQHKTLDCRKLHNPLSNSCHRSGKWHVWQRNGIRLWSFWPVVGIYFLIVIRGWVIKFWTF